MSLAELIPLVNNLGQSDKLSLLKVLATLPTIPIIFSYADSSFSAKALAATNLG